MERLNKQRLVSHSLSCSLNISFSLVTAAITIDICVNNNNNNDRNKISQLLLPTTSVLFYFAFSSRVALLVKIKILTTFLIYHFLFFASTRRRTCLSGLQESLLQMSSLSCECDTILNIFTPLLLLYSSNIPIAFSIFLCGVV